MRCTAWAVCVILIAAIPAISGDWVTLNPSEEAVAVQVLTTDGERTVLNYNINGFPLEQVSIAGKVYTLMGKLRKESTIEEPGYPRLPRLNRSLVIPDEGVMDCKVLSAEYVDLSDLDLAPSKGHLLRSTDPAAVPYTFADIYQENAFFPDKLVELGEPYLWRDFRGIVLTLNAFQYNPVLRTLRVYTNVKVEVTKIASGGKNVMVRTQPLQKLDPQFHNIYRRHFVNFDESNLDYPYLLDSGEMLIICYDGFMSDLDSLVAWKNQKGIPTTIVPVSQVGNTTNRIRRYIRDYYRTHNLAYVLLVGDYQQVAAFTSGSDPVYSLLRPTDWYPSIFVGRFSAENSAQVQTQVLRTLNYEKYPNPALTWYHQGLGTADQSGPCNPEPTDALHITYIAMDLVHWNYTQMDSVYTPWGSTTMISNFVNLGRSIWNYAGHGSVSMIGPPNFTITNVNALRNDNMLPHIVTIACNVGQFNGYTCLGEAFLRAANPTTSAPTGAIGAYMSKISQTWFPPYDMQDEGVDLLVVDSVVTFGGMCFNGSGLMIDNYGSQGENEFKNWNIFGDPSLFLRSAAPYSLTVTHDAVLHVGATTFSVTVTGPGGPLNGAMVCGMNSQIYATGITNSSGLVTLVFDPAPTQTGSFTLTVTTSNAIPNIATVPIVARGAALAGSVVTPNLTSTVPKEFGLVQISPNPFNPSTVIRYKMQDASLVSLRVYDTAGRLVTTLVNGWRDAGDQQVTFDGSNLASGVYLYHLEAGDVTAVRKMVLMK